MGAHGSAYGTEKFQRYESVKGKGRRTWNSVRNYEVNKGIGVRGGK